MKKKRGWRPNKTTKPVVYFDLEAGCWFCDAHIMKKMYRNGLRKIGLKSGQDVLKMAYDLVSKQPSAELKENEK